MTELFCSRFFCTTHSYLQFSTFSANICRQNCLLRRKLLLWGIFSWKKCFICTVWFMPQRSIYVVYWLFFGAQTESLSWHFVLICQNPPVFASVVPAFDLYFVMYCTIWLLELVESSLTWGNISHFGERLSFLRGPFSTQPASYGNIGKLESAPKVQTVFCCAVANTSTIFTPNFTLLKSNFKSTTSILLEWLTCNQINKLNGSRTIYKRSDPIELDLFP